MKGRLETLLIILLMVSACTADNKESSSEVPEVIDESTTTTHYLKDNRSTIELDKSFVKSSRYRVSQDVAVLKSNKDLAEFLQKALNFLEFEDSQLDVFVNSADQLNFFFIQKLSPITITKEKGQLLNLQMDEWLENVNKREKTPVVKKLSANLKKSPEMSYYKFRYVLHENDPKRKVYMTNYFVVTPVKTYLVSELNNKEASIENSIRTLSNGT